MSASGPMTAQQALDYARGLGLFARGVSLSADEIGDGNLNYVYRIVDQEGGGSVILKQAVPFLRCVGEGSPLSVRRIAIEGEALTVQEPLVGDLVPKVIHRDHTRSVLVLEDLSHLDVVRHGLNRGRQYPRLAEHLARYLSRLAFYTSDVFLSLDEKANLVARFRNPELCQITADLVFTEPFFDSARNVASPGLRDYLSKHLWRNDAVIREAALLKHHFKTSAQSLLHGDLHTGSVFAGPDRTVVFDLEFAFVGPTAFDIGKFVANLVINYAAAGVRLDPPSATAQREYLLGQVRSLGTSFDRELRQCWDQDAREEYGRSAMFRDAYCRSVSTQALGYAAVCMIRRMHGLARTVDIEGIPDESARLRTQVAVLELATELLLQRHRHDGIDDLIRLVRARGL